jgi:HrpA-like RNA helicase
MSISEKSRVEFTKKLRDLRDNPSTRNVVFASTLTTDERKFVHKISTEFGLKSKSSGKDDRRFITVSKKENNSQRASGLAPVIWSPFKTSIPLLGDGSFAAVRSGDRGGNRYDTAGVGSDDPSRQHGGHRAQQLRARVCQAYAQAQAQRRGNSAFVSMQAKRAFLPAWQHQGAVCTLLKEHQIVLISGETGAHTYVRR